MGKKKKLTWLQTELNQTKRRSEKRGRIITGLAFISKELNVIRLPVIPGKSDSFGCAIFGGKVVKTTQAGFPVCGKYLKKGNYYAGR